MKCLAVDDEFVALTKMSTLLSDYGTCETASNGEQAMAMFHKAFLEGMPYQLITIDIDMPGMNGIQLLKKISIDESLLFLPKAYKIIVTAEGSPGNVIQAIENKCDSFLVKPVKKDTLQLRLKELGILKM
jgi:two-component system, chemotaxis family, chemotaxis protein CheY